MITIGHEQFEAFEKKAHQDFEDELLAHLEEFSPRHTAGVGDDGMRTLIRSGLLNARKYGYKLRGSLRFFVECQVMFGHEFDTDPLIPWGNREFGYKNWTAELTRADEIHDVAMAFRLATVGENEEVEAAAIERLLARPVSEWLGGDQSNSATVKLINEVYPEKVAQAPAALLTLVERGNRAATACGMTSSGGRVITALMVAFGHGVLSDPQFPWVAQSIRSNMERSPKKRVEALAIRALAYLSDGLAHMKRG